MRTPGQACFVFLMKIKEEGSFAVRLCRERPDAAGQSLLGESEVSGPGSTKHPQSCVCVLLIHLLSRV